MDNGEMSFGCPIILGRLYPVPLWEEVLHAHMAR
jgi:hypothetical protein